MTGNVEIRRYRRFAGWDYTKGVSLFRTMADLRSIGRPMGRM